MLPTSPFKWELFTTHFFSSLSMRSEGYLHTCYYCQVLLAQPGNKLHYGNVWCRRGPVKRGITHSVTQNTTHTNAHTNIYSPYWDSETEIQIQTDTWTMAGIVTNICMNHKSNHKTMKWNLNPKIFLVLVDRTNLCVTGIITSFCIYPIGSRLKRKWQTAGGRSLI